MQAPLKSSNSDFGEFTLFLVSGAQARSVAAGVFLQPSGRYPPSGKLQKFKLREQAQRVRLDGSKCGR